MKYEFSLKVVRSLKKIKKKDKKLGELIVLKLKVFEIDENRPSLRLHKLSGGMSEMWSIAINESIRMVFYYKNKDKAVFIKIGKHEDVYRK